MYCQMYINIFLVCFEAWIVVSENSCTVDRTCSATFVYFGFRYNGTDNGPPSSSMAMVSLDCLRNANCKGFLSDPSRASFTPCIRAGIWDITFTSGMYVKRKLTRLNLGYDSVTKGIDTTISIPEGVTPGDTIYLRFTLTKFDNLDIIFVVDNSNFNYNYRARCDDPCAEYFKNCNDLACAQNKYVTITYLQNGIWQSQPFRDDNYDLKLNQQEEMLFLVLNKAVKLYRNQQLYHTHSTPYDFASIKVYGIRILGTVDVHEFSL